MKRYSKEMVEEIYREYAILGKTLLNIKTKTYVMLYTIVYLLDVATALFSWYVNPERFYIVEANQYVVKLLKYGDFSLLVIHTLSAFVMMFVPLAIYKWIWLKTNHNGWYQIISVGVVIMFASMVGLHIFGIVGNMITALFAWLGY